MSTEAAVTVPSHTGVLEVTAQPAQRPWWHWLWLVPYNIIWFAYDFTRFCIYNDDEEVRAGASLLIIVAVIALEGTPKLRHLF